MPKDNSERIIDWPYSPTKSRSGTVSSGGGGGGGGGGATNLDALTDVTVAAPANGQVLTYEAASGQWKNSAAGSGGVPNPHGLSSSYHSGLLSWALVDKTGSNLADIATRPHSALTGIGPNDHHAQAHAIVSADHTASGLTAGQTIRANSPTGFAWALLDHTDLNPASITPNQHHNQVHNIVGTDHTIAGSQFQVVGATGTNVLGLLTPSSSPGAAAAILRTDSSGSLSLDTNLLYVDAINNRVGINRATGNAALDIQVSALADHSQRIKQVSGQTGRMWRLEDIPGNELIVVDSVGNMQSGQPGFVSGLTGWQISYLGNAEFNNIWARGELHATVFVKDEVHVGGGTILVASGGKLHSQATIDSTHADIEPLEIVSSVPGVSGPLTIRTTSGAFSGTTLDIRAILNYLEIDDPPSGPGFYFTQGDVIRSKTEVSTGVTDFWLEVNNPKQFTGYSRYSVIKRSGTDGPLPAGSGVGSYGKPGDGRILLTSDLNYAPYLDVFTVGQNVWTGAAGSIVPRVRLGRLDGVGLPGTTIAGITGVEQYGLIAGTDLSNANTPYFIASNQQFKLYKINITLNDGTNDTAQINQNGSLTLGKNIAVDAGKSFQVINGTGTSSDGNVILGNKTLNNYVEWNNNTGVLTVVGAIAVPGGGASTAYVDAQDAANRKRNVLAVTGSWSVTGPASVSWGSPNAVLVNLGGINYAVTAGSLGGLSALTWYLYVDTSTAAPFTVQATTNSSVLGVDMVVVAVFAPGTTFGSITLMGGTTVISGSNIITGTIVAAHLTTGSVTADKIWAGVGITLGVIGAINGGTKTFGAGAGFFLGYDAGVYKFDIGDTTNYLRWDGTNLTLGAAGVGGIITVGTNGAVRSGTKTYGAAAAGFFLGYDAGAPAGFKFDVGSSANYLRWDGSALTIQARTLLMSIEGNMAINANGSISGGGKTYGVGTGFFLGQSGGAGNYQFDIGNATNFLRFDGSTLFINANNIAAFNAAGGTNLLSLATTGLAVTFDVITNPVTGSGAALQITAPVNVSGGSGYLRANKLMNAGSTMQIENFRTDLTTSSPGLGNTGEIAWVRISGVDYLYLCYQGTGATAQWKRVQMNTF